MSSCYIINEKIVLGINKLFNLVMLMTGLRVWLVNWGLCNFFLLN
jgi:hypothetical protein